MSHSVVQKLFLDNSASFTSSRMEDLCPKMEVETNFSRRLKEFGGLTRLTLSPIFHDRSTPLAKAGHARGLRSEDEDKDKDLVSSDKDRRGGAEKDLENGSAGSSKKRTFLEDNNNTTETVNETKLFPTRVLEDRPVRIRARSIRTTPPSAVVASSARRGRTSSTSYRAAAAGTR